MSPISALPDLDWTENSRFEIGSTDPASLFAMSDMAWQIKDILIVGLIYVYLTSPPWMWFALTNKVTFRDLVEFKRLKDKIPRGTLTAVAEDFRMGQRFARFYGFMPTGNSCVEAERSYLIYRKV